MTLQFPKTTSPIADLSRIPSSCWTPTSGLRRGHVMKFLECAQRDSCNAVTCPARGLLALHFPSPGAGVYAHAAKSVLMTRTKTTPREQQSDRQKPLLTTL